MWAKVEELHLENRLKQDLITLEYILDYLMLIQYTRLNISAKNTPIFFFDKSAIFVKNSTQIIDKYGWYGWFWPYLSISWI